MTYLTLTRQKIVVPSLPRIFSLVLSFQTHNRKGLVTLLLVGMIILSGVGYLLLLSRVFDLGFRMQSFSRQMPELTDEAQSFELELQHRQFAFDGAHAGMVGSMERISSVKYLTPHTVSVSQAEPKVSAD